MHRAVPEIASLLIQTFSFPELQQLNCRVSMLDTVGFLLKYQCVERRKCRVSIEPTSNPGTEDLYYCGCHHCCWNENVPGSLLGNIPSLSANPQREFLMENGISQPVMLWVLPHQLMRCNSVVSDSRKELGFRANHSAYLLRFSLLVQF